MSSPAAGEMTGTDRFAIDASASAETGSGVAGADLETPRTGALGDTWTLPISGWVVGSRAPAVRVTVAQAGEASWDLPVHDRRPDVAHLHPEIPWARHAGFSGAVGALRLPLRFELEVSADVPDVGRVPIGSATGRRAPLESAYEPELRPLMVTTLGRTGSTWLVHLLAQHPDVVAYRPFSFEPRAATYWIDILTSLAEPSSYTQQVDGEVRYPDPWWLGTQTRMTSERLPDEELSRWLGSDNVSDLAGVAQQRIDALYTRVASLSERRPEFFAEKCLPQGNVPGLLWELYPDAREIFLVRDFRDMLCSIRSFNAKRAASDFGLDGAQSDQVYVEQVLSPSVKSLVREWRRRADRAHLVRYEDLVRDPRSALSGMLEYLGRDAAPQLVESMVAAAAREIPEMEAHRTSGSALDSIGRWRRELPEELVRLCEESYGEELEELGYE